MIKVNQLNKYFNRRKKNEIHVLNDISLEFPEKGLVVLLGPSGSGKTTLLNVLGGLDKVQSGTIDFDDEMIQGYDVHAWDKIRNEYVGYIFQNYNLLPELSVYDNIAFVLKMMGIKDPEIIDQRVIYILKAVHMYPFRKKKALQLSGGQQQRVAIARALVKNPKVIIADEPTGNLDSKNTLDIMNIIKQISQEKLVVLVTHEKHIANFYGDRIIEVKDGKIISDEVNESSDERHIGKDDTIYLKDYKHISDASTKGINLSLYGEHEDDLKDMDIKLIVKNKTLYLDIKSPYKKTKLIDDNSGVVIKDAHYVKKTKEELIETNFDQEMLDNEHVDRQSKTLVSVKQSLWMAFQKVLRTSRKGKLMLFSFLVAGMVIAVTVSMLASVAILKPEEQMQMPRGYVNMVPLANSNHHDADALLAIDDGTHENFYINPYGQNTLNFIEPNGSQSSVSIRGNIENVDHVDERDLLFGELPKENEILISKVMADMIIEGGIFSQASGQEFGIWSYEYLIREYVKVQDIEARISGIVDTEISLIYMHDELALYDYAMRSVGMMPFSYFEGELVAGVNPIEDQVLISSGLYENLFGDTNYTETFPITLEGYDYEISGVYEDDEAFTEIMLDSYLFKEVINNKSGSIYVYAEDSVVLKEDLEKTFTRHDVTDVYEAAVIDAKAFRSEALLTTLTISSVLIGISMIGFYFVIRSSLISRIYEVSVYRALGVKKNDIFISFFVEIIVLTTISTFIGYVIASIGLNKLSQGFIGEFNFFTVNALTFVLGLITAYVINILAGMFPIYLLLKKTPAQILSQYDI